MLDLFGWDVGMSTIAAFLLFGIAAVIGIASYFIGEVRAWYEGVITGLAALIGGYIGSESLAGASTWGWEFEGLFIVPALIGAVVVGGIVDVIVRNLTGGSYAYEPRPV